MIKATRFNNIAQMQLTNPVREAPTDTDVEVFKDSRSFSLQNDPHFYFSDCSFLTTFRLGIWDRTTV